MPVILLEVRDFTNPLFLVRTWALISGCLTFSLASTLKPQEIHGPPPRHFTTIRTSCMFTWCFFFTLTFLISVLSTIRFHSLLPISWRNLTVTSAALGALMCLSATVAFPYVLMDRTNISARPVAVAVCSGLTTLAYVSEIHIIRRTQEQRGYMASVPGLLKVVQLWGACQMIPLVKDWFHEALVGETEFLSRISGWHLWVPGVLYCLSFLWSLVTVLVLLGELAGRCPLPFDWLVVGCSVLGTLFYMVTTMICFYKVQLLWSSEPEFVQQRVLLEMFTSSFTLLAYSADFIFGIKLLCGRNRV